MVVSLQCLGKYSLSPHCLRGFCEGGVSWRFFNKHNIVLTPTEITEALQDEVWFPKNNDLYTFEQTDDLRVSELKPIKDFCSAIYSEEFRGFLESITGIKLDTKVDISSHIYRKGEYHPKLCWHFQVVTFFVTTMNLKEEELLLFFIWFRKTGLKKMEVRFIVVINNH